jgi:undecaprenyl-diphosphatase
MEYRLEQWINGSAGHHPALDNLMVHAASWGEAVFIALVVAWLLLGWLGDVPAERQGAVTALIGAGGALLANQIVMHLWTRPRPFVAHPGTVHVLLSHSTDPGFPSDHASPAFAIGVILFIRHRRLGSGVLLFAALMSYARVYVGDHYPGDVLAGALIGLVVALVLTTWLEPVIRGLCQFGDRMSRRMHLPLLGSAPVFIAWLRSRRAWGVRLQQGRVLLSLGVGLWTVGYVVETARDVVVETGNVALPVAFLIGCLVLLSGVSLALLTVGLRDLRAGWRRRERRGLGSTRVLANWAMTLSWALLILTAGVVMLGLELHYPAI